MERYRELAPPVGLEVPVACIWIGDDGPVRVLPDACVDVVFAGGRIVVAGPATRVDPAPATPGQFRCGVRFRVGAAGDALGLPAAELLDRGVDLAELWGAPTARRLTDRVAAQPTQRAALAALVQGVGGRVDATRPDPLVRRAARQLTLGGAALPQAARAVGLGERQLRRRFERAVGYGPATLVRVLRFQRFLALAQRTPGTPLARLAADAGYADQAHLARECRRLSDLTPAELLAAGAGPAGERSGSFKRDGAPSATLAA